MTDQETECPVETTLSLIGDKWKVLIIGELLAGVKRFGELHRTIASISQKMLAQQLRQMEKDGLVTRKIYAEVPPRVEYSLTELGMSLKPILYAMAKWGSDYKKGKAGMTCAAKKKRYTTKRSS